MLYSIRGQERGTYERTARALFRVRQRAKPFCVFNPDTGKLMIGRKSLHRTTQSRMWRLFWRLKYDRRHDDGLPLYT